MRTGLLSVACAILLSCASVASAELKLTMSQGSVTVLAEGVPLRQILAEWARVGQTTIVGAERLSGPPVTLRLENVPERQALETLLRSASGYMAAPRTQPAGPSASLYDRILILPTSSAPPMAAAGPVRPGVRPAQVVREAEEPPPFDFSEPQAPERDPFGDVPADFSEAQRNGLDPADGGQIDYANPQAAMQRRQQGQQEFPTGAAVPGVIAEPPAQAPNVFPGTATRGATRVAQPPVSARPGEIVQPGQGGAFNPYGLPPGVQPGSVQGSPMEPDRSKYANPYNPETSDPDSVPE
jgi:hypothetical protein